MPVNVEEIKKLSDKEKLLLVDEILDSVNPSAIDNYLATEEDETDNILKERWEIYQSGKMQFDSWENVYERLKAKIISRQANRNNEL
jgi:putative addiction module component (TIGR02574 family)